MIQQPERFEAWQREWLRKEPIDYETNLRVIEALYEEARALGVFPLKHPLEGLEAKIELARRLNVSRAA